MKFGGIVYRYKFYIDVSDPELLGTLVDTNCPKRQEEDDVGRQANFRQYRYL
jgi:hypothetical protein